MRRPRFDENRGFYAAVGREIANARSGKMTQEQLAKHAKLSRTSIVNIEKGGQQILLHTVVGIARALNVSVADLLPKVDSLDLALSDKPQSGVEWIRSSTKAIKG